ncbi:hypothetical protein VX159_13210 [Dechloromonas sp. ZY10]|uniref:hypothetical protein n=1 Tax=Dechloromonas aquae TaxID=2664436 RepID=UPI0035276C53
MKERYLKEAKDMLDVMVKSQPALIHPHHASEDTGRLLADFCAAFVRQYASHLEALDKEPHTG